MTHNKSPQIKMPPRSRRGSAMALIIIISIILTGLIMTIAWQAGVQSQVASSQMKMDRAFYAAEAGAQRALWYFRKDHTWRAATSAPLTGSITIGTDAFNYSATCVTATGSNVTISSTATAGSVSNSVTMTVAPPVTVVVPALGMGGDLTMKNLSVIGDVYTQGSVTDGGGSASVSGSLHYGVSLTGSISVGTPPAVHDTSTANQISSPNYATMAAYYTGPAITNPASGTTFDFTGAGVDPTHPVIFVTGSVTNPSFIGAGTLLCTGDMSVGNNVGSSTQRINLVTEGNISTPTNWTIYGTIYAEGTWNRNKCNVYGNVAIKGSIAVGSWGNSTIDSTGQSAPWFDPHAASSSGTITISNFTGMMP